MGSVGVLGMDMILDSQNWMLFLATAGTDDTKILQKSSLGHIRLECTWHMDPNEPKAPNQGSIYITLALFSSLVCYMEFLSYLFK